MESLGADISLWRFPASLILGAAFLLLLWAANRYWPHSRPYRLLTALQTAIVLLLVSVGLLIAEGIWAVGLYHTWPFIGVVLLLTASLGLTVLRHRHKRRGAAFLLSHGGMFIILWGALFGAPDITQARMVIHEGTSSKLAYTASGEVVPLPFDVHLDRFTTDYYDDERTPRQFRSAVRFDNTPAAIAVNAPAHHRGYTFYQESYDKDHGAFTVLLVVRDPWLGIVWAGMALLAAGFLILLLRRQ